MANTDAALAALKAELKDFKVQLIKALDKPSASAEYADVADTLGGMTGAQIEMLAIDEVTKHTQKVGVNVHGIQPGQLGSYNKAEYDARLDMLADADGGVPFSFYGDNEFLPPAVTGSFESGSNTTPYNNVAMMMEDNGTLMILRPGTDGDSAGVYYSYLRNAMTETDLGNLVMSNVEYRPAYFPAGMRAKAILNGGQDIITGIMKDEITGAHTGYFISLTNNTMDQTKHTGVFVPNGDFLKVVGPYPALYHVPFGFVKGNYVYILHDIWEEEKIGHRVWRIALNDLVTSVFRGATRITGWIMNRGAGGVVVRDDIILFDDVESCCNRLGKPSTLVFAGNGANCPTSITRDDGSSGVMFSHYVQFRPNDNLTSIVGYQWYYKYEFSESKQIDVSAYHDWKATMAYTAAGWEPQESACLRQWAFFSHQRYQQGQDTTSVYSNVYNQLWLWTTTSYMSSNKALYRFVYDEGLDPLAVLAGEANMVSVIGTNPVGRFGSGLTASYCAISNVGDDVLTCYNFGRFGNSQIGKFYVRSELVGDPTFQYSSVTGRFAYKGFAPTAQRKSHTDLGLPTTNFERLVNEASPGVSRVSQARFSSWFPAEVNRPSNVDRNLNVSGSVSVPAVVMSSLRTQILADLATRGYVPSTEIPGSDKFAFELTIPQVYTDMPPFIIGTIMNAADRTFWMFVYSVTISGSRAALTGASIQAASCVMWRNDGSVGTAMGLYSVTHSGQTAIRRVAGGFMVGFSDSTYYNVVGNSGRALLLLQYVNGVWKNNGAVYWDYWEGTAPAGWINLPSRGLYFGLSSEFIYGEIDCGSKMVAVLAAANSPTDLTPNELNTQCSDKTKANIMVSQRVVSAWTVYFSDETPAMLDGYYLPVLPMNYDLNPATDGNKTFHVWLVRNGAALNYKVVDTSTAAPAVSALYLGYFTTTNTGLKSINVEKRVAVDGYMLSPVARGSSIPLTSGTPNSYGRLNWD